MFSWLFNRTSPTDFGPLSKSPNSAAARTLIETVVGPYIDNGDGTVTDVSRGLTWIRAPWGMLWNGETFDGVPIKLNWWTATKWFGGGERIPFQGAEIRESASDIVFGVHQRLTGNRKVYFAGYDDWRLPNALELDSLGIYLRRSLIDRVVNRDPAACSRDELELWKLLHHWHWQASDNVSALKRLFPEWQRINCRLWSCTGIDSYTAYSYDGLMPAGDNRLGEKYGVMLTRSLKKDSAIVLASTSKVEALPVDIDTVVSSTREGVVNFSPEKIRIGQNVQAGELLTTIVDGGFGVSAERSGVITHVHVKNGQRVQNGDRFVSILPDAQSAPTELRKRLEMAIAAHKTSTTT